MDLVQGRREGVRVWDLEGRDYINCRSSGGVFNFGHSPSFAVEALTTAVREHDMGDWLLPSARRARGRRGAARLLPEPLRFTFFTASGAEAVEVACKLARSVTGRTELRLRRARLSRPRRLLAGDGRPAAVGPLSAADAGHHAGALRRGGGAARRRRLRHGGGDHGDDPRDRRLPRAARGLLHRDAPDLRRDAARS